MDKALFQQAIFGFYPSEALPDIRALALVGALLIGSTAAYAQDLSLGLEFANEGNYEAALLEWRPLAEQGDPAAQYGLGVFYANGHGVAQNDAEAIRWYRLAAANGHAEAQNHLGGMYFTGRGVLQDYRLAHMWFNIASVNGSLSASALRNFVENQMTSTDISTAQELARICLDSGYTRCN